MRSLRLCFVFPYSSTPISMWLCASMMGVFRGEGWLGFAGMPPGRLPVRKASGPSRPDGETRCFAPLSMTCSRRPCGTYLGYTTLIPCRVSVLARLGGPVEGLVHRVVFDRLIAAQSAGADPNPVPIRTRSRITSRENPDSRTTVPPSDIVLPSVGKSLRVRFAVHRQLPEGPYRNR